MSSDLSGTIVSVDLSGAVLSIDLSGASIFIDILSEEKNRKEENINENEQQKEIHFPPLTLSDAANILLEEEQEPDTDYESIDDGIDSP